MSPPSTSQECLVLYHRAHCNWKHIEDLVRVAYHWTLTGRRLQFALFHGIGFQQPALLFLSKQRSTLIMPTSVCIAHLAVLCGTSYSTFWQDCCYVVEIINRLQDQDHCSSFFKCRHNDKQFYMGNTSFLLSRWKSGDFMASQSGEKRRLIYVWEWSSLGPDPPRGHANWPWPLTF